MDKNNEANGISIQDLEQWFDEEFELYGTKDKFNGWEHVELVGAKIHILNNAKQKILEQTRAELNSKRIKNVIQVLMEYGLAADCSGSALIEVGDKCLDDIVQELNKALE